MNTGFVRSVVATALTVYGIETRMLNVKSSHQGLLQQHLPFTVLKLNSINLYVAEIELQQHLPFTVLKPKSSKIWATALQRCNSTYRLRY